MKRTFLRIVFVIAMSMSDVSADVTTESYCLPILGPIAVYRAEPYLASDEAGSHQLVEVNAPSPGVGLSFSHILPHLERYAVHDQFVVGKTKEWYFILKMPTPDSAPQPETFATKEEWLSKLKTAGVPANIELLNPDTVAATKTDQIIRPWKFRVMQGRLGVSDDMWSLIVQIIGIVLCLTIGLLAARRYRLLPVAIIIGVLVNIVGQIVIAGGGPGAFVGFFVLPLYCLLAAHLGRLMRRVTFGWKEEHTANGMPLR